MGKKADERVVSESVHITEKKKGRLSSVTAVIGKSATLEMAAKAKAMNERGIGVISFSAGEPDFDTPKRIKEAAKKAIDLGFTKYTDSSGIKELKTAIRQKFLRENNLHYDEANIAVTPGAKYAIYAILQSIISPGDEVVIPVPYWVSYVSMVKLSRGVPVFCYPAEAFGFRLTLADITQVLTEKTRAVIINTPNNPTGAVYRSSDLEEIVNYLAGRDIYVISDEIYERLTYGTAAHISAASVVSEKLRRNVIVVNGFSKAYAMTGWRIGYAAGPRDVMERMKHFLDHTTSNTNTITMYAAVEALNGPQTDVEQMVGKFDRRRRFIFEEVSKLPRVTCIRPDGAFYLFANFQQYLGGSFGDRKIATTVDLANLLLEEAHVAVVPGEAFGAPGYIRFSYATSLDNIAEGLENMKHLLGEISFSE